MTQRTADGEVEWGGVEEERPGLHWTRIVDRRQRPFRKPTLKLAEVESIDLRDSATSADEFGRIRHFRRGRDPQITQRTADGKAR